MPLPLIFRDDGMRVCMSCGADSPLWLPCTPLRRQMSATLLTAAAAIASIPSTAHVIAVQSYCASYMPCIPFLLHPRPAGPCLPRPHPFAPLPTPSLLRPFHTRPLPLCLIPTVRTHAPVDFHCPHHHEYTVPITN